MFESVKAGWRLASTVRRMVRSNRELLVYPVISAVIGFLLFLGTMIGAFMIPLNIQLHWRELIAVVAAYIVTAFVSTYFLVAMLIDFRSTISGNPIGLGEALSRTRPYTSKILQWAIFYTILVMILRVLESRFRGIGAIVIGIVGSLGITIATFFAVPAILERKAGPIQAVKDSVSTITRTFGPTFGGMAYVDLYTLAYFLLGLAVIIASVFLLGFSFILMLALVVVGIGLMIFGFIQNYTFFNILKLILYDYYNGVALPEGITEGLVNAAVKTRKTRL